MGLVLSTTATTRPHGKKGGFQQRSQENAGGESGNVKDSVEKREEGDGSDVQSAEEDDIAWNAYRVPASSHATTRQREGSRRRVDLGGRGELLQGWTALESNRIEIQSAEEDDIAWNAYRVPASICATTRQREGARRRVELGGRAKLGKSLDSIAEPLEGLPER